MAKRNEPHPGQTLEQIETAGDRIAEWIGENPTLILGAALGILIIAGAWGFAASSRTSAALEASDALAEAQVAYREAMGADPESNVVPEPANPETARAVRTEFVETFREIAEEHSGTVASDVAWMEVGSLQTALGEVDAAIETWQRAAGEADGRTTEALLLARIASAYEAEGRWLEAAESYEAASAVDGYPLRYNALGEAARCYAEANEVDRAIAALDVIETEAPDTVVPEHVRLYVEELRAGRTSG